MTLQDDCQLCNGNFFDENGERCVCYKKYIHRYILCPYVGFSDYIIDTCFGREFDGNTIPLTLLAERKLTFLLTGDKIQIEAKIARALYEHLKDFVQYDSSAKKLKLDLLTEENVDEVNTDVGYFFVKGTSDFASQSFYEKCFRRSRGQIVCAVPSDEELPHEIAGRISTLLSLPKSTKHLDLSEIKIDIWKR